MTNLVTDRRRPSDPPEPGSWHSQPVVWLGIAVLAATLAGIIWLIVVAARHQDDVSLSAGHRVFGVPAQQQANPRP